MEKCADGVFYTMAVSCRGYLPNKAKIKLHFGDCFEHETGRDTLIAQPETRSLLLISS